MHSLIVGGYVAAATQDVLALPHPVRGKVYGRADGVPRAPGAANQLQLDPVVMIRVDVPEKRGRSVFEVDDNIDFTVFNVLNNSFMLRPQIKCRIAAVAIDFDRV